MNSIKPSTMISAGILFWVGLAMVLRTFNISKHYYELFGGWGILLLQILFICVAILSFSSCFAILVRSFVITLYELTEAANKREKARIQKRRTTSGRCRDE